LYVVLFFAFHARSRMMERNYFKKVKLLLVDETFALMKIMFLKVNIKQNYSSR
jgi:hypothetical protein